MGWDHSKSFYSIKNACRDALNDKITVHLKILEIASLTFFKYSYA